MGECKIVIEEVRFDNRHPGLTHVYIAVRAEGDCPIGTEGWYHKSFPSKISVIEIYQKHFADFLTWARGAP